MYIHLHVKYPLWLSDFSQIHYSQQIFKELSDIKFNWIMSSGIQVVPCQWTDRHTDIPDEANGHFSQFRVCA